MLNLPIAMLQYLFSLTFFFLAQASQTGITFPLPGQELRGQVEILGVLDSQNFSSGELSFAYGASNSAESWFLIQQISQPAEGSTLAVWDTTALTDGIYTLRLRVNLQDGIVQDFFVTGLKISNDVPLPTVTSSPTPTMTLTAVSEQPTATPAPPTATPVFPTPQPLPTNPAEVTAANIQTVFGRGAALALGLFLLVSLLLRFRRN